MSAMPRRWCGSVLGALLLVAPSVSRAQNGAIPITEAGRQLTGWLSAVNSGNRETFRKFLTDNAPSQLGTLDQLFNLARRTGGFDYRRTVTSTDTALTSLVQERGSDQIARIILQVESAPPHRITQLNISAVPRPADMALAAMSDSALAVALQTRLSEATAADRFAGAVLVTRAGATVYSGAFGLADRERKIPNAVDTRFRIGSMNKMFTAVAVLQLVQAGKIQLNAPFGQYVTDYPNRDVASRVTIHQLLTHTGGTGDIFGPDFFAHRLELRAVNDFLARFGGRDVQFEPGSQWAYSNYGFILLGAVIERVSGVSYYDYVRDHVYQPAGMTSTGSEPETETVANRSVGYMRSPGDSGFHPNTETLPWRGMPAGGGYSTVGDLVRFATALTNHTLLNPLHTEMLTTGKVDAMGAKYAYGFVDRRTASGARFFGHGGGAPGMNGELAIFPESGVVVAVLSNLDPPAASAVSDFITNRLTTRVAARP
jgi:D-alanyl-D-alanine carboxypeptidase